MGAYSLKIHRGVSKKSGKQYEALELCIGQYKTLVFPSPFELMYIKKVLRKNAHDDFADSADSTDSDDSGDDDDF